MSTQKRMPWATKWVNRFTLLLLLFVGMGMCLHAQVVANFTSSSPSGCGPLLVTFTSTSTGSISSYNWNFGNGNLSTAQNPAAVYNNPGTYTVTLTVSGPGGTDTKTVVNYITVFQKPDVFIGSTPTSGCAPLTVQFTNNSVAYPGPIVSVLWDFGDGITSTTNNPVHTYANPGTYTVVLSVTDNNGCTQTASSTTSIQVTAPVTANFTASPTSGCSAPMLVNFTDQSTGSGPFTYSWNFGDGSPLDNTQNPSHSYLANGTYTVTLIISNGSGCRDTLVRTNYITIAPIAVAFTGTPTQVCVGSPVAFTDNSGGAPTSWNWTFGDGGTSTLQNPSHTYAAPGTYTVSLTAGSGPGCSNTVTQTNYITVLPRPTAAFLAMNNNGCQAPWTVNFLNNSSGGVSYLWDFGDGNTSTTASPSHTYTANGTYTVTLTVTGANGCTATLTQTNIVQISPPVAYFTWVGIQTGCRPKLINFTDSSYTAFGTITNWQWDFGDGQTANNQNPNHNYNNVGTFTVTLIVTNSLGCKDTLVFPNFVTIGPDPVADFSGTPQLICAGQSVSFTDLSANANSWSWNFGDGGTSTAQNPTHVYSSLGCYTVTLTATNTGCSDIKTRNNYICVQGTEALFTFSPPNACDTPATVTFTNGSTGVNPAAYWDFGDGVRDSSFSPVHVYHAFGNFIVQLISHDLVTGCRDTITDTVKISHPVASFNTGATSGCAPLVANFNNTSVGGSTYLWDFGDGATSALQNPAHTYSFSGNFIVSLIVVDVNGCRDTATAPAAIVVHDVVPNFSATPRPTCVGTPITFTSLATSDTTLLTWSWDFGDGSPLGTGSNPVHSYANPGTYTVSMTATDANGCSDTRTRGGYIVITRPTPGFAMSNTLLCPGEVLQLGTTSSGANPLSYAWTFGDGGTSTANNPSHVYAANGVYNIQVVVTDANGCKDSTAQAMTIQSPVAAFTISDSIVDCPPLIANFQNTSTGNISSYTWDFGDGTPTVSNIPNPSHIYNNPGVFTVTLIVRTPTGCMDTLVVPGRAVVNAPMATFSFGPSTTCPGQPVVFTMSPVNTYLTAWDFGDGTVVIGGDTVIHSYSSAGTLTPSLIVRDSALCPNSAPGAGQIVILPTPIADFTYSDTLLCAADTLDFIDATTFGGGVSTYQWTFGDGGTDSVPNPSHFYSAPGIYTVTLSVTDTLGCSDADTVVKAVYFFDYQAGFDVAPIVACPNSDVVFMDSSFSDTTKAGWTWDFGDLLAGSGDTVIHQYADTGWYDVQLIMSTVIGCIDTVLVPNAVYIQIPTGTFTISSDTTCPLQPLQYTFTGGNWIVPTWYFGNGDSVVGGDTVSYAFTNPGTYGATVLMTDTLGCTATIPTPFPVTVMPGPVAAIAIDSLVHCEPDSVRFWDMSTYSSPIASINWDFGDGGNATGPAVTHFYNSPAYYTVQLIVMDQLGCSDTILDTAGVRIHQQVADFGSDVQVGCLPVTITFSDSSFADTTIVSYAWDFGDGNTGGGITTSHVYTDTGFYDVTLVITTLLGCTDTVVYPGFIDLHSPNVPSLWAATVEGDNEVAVVYRQDTNALFASYELWQETGPGSYTHIATETTQTDTVLFDFASSSLVTSNCYRPQITDVCNDSTPLPPTVLHCTMDLMAIPGTDENVLTWTPYVGWAGVQRYDVFAVQDYDTSSVQFLGSVSGIVTNFTDSTVYCDDLRSYRVRAVGLLPQQRSWSDSSAARPVHTPPSYVPTMVTATVLNNLDVTVEWDSATFVGANGYELFRSQDGATWSSLGLLPSGTTQFVDQTANVGAVSYYYRIAVADSCTYYTVPSDHARSILLTLDGSNGTVHLTWNPYGNWPAGIDHYVVEGMPLTGGPWTTMATLPPGTTVFNDNQGLPGAPGTCYRVVAFESGGHLASSQSNEVCYTMDIWVPNTITPNGDGLNDVLIVRALAGYPGTGITIFNRWGNLVYEVDDYHNDWAGTNGKSGENLPDGTYYWILHVSDGRTLKGFVTILR